MRNADTSKDHRAELIRLAAEMARGHRMPSPYYEDHNFYVSTPKAERIRLIEIARQADDQCKDWAVRIKQVADALRTVDETSGDA